MINTCIALLMTLLSVYQAKDFEGWIRLLGAEELGKRDEAESLLRKCLDRALPELRRATKDGPDGEARPRAARLLQEASAGGLLWMKEEPGEVVWAAERYIILWAGPYLRAFDSQRGIQRWSFEVDSHNPDWREGVAVARMKPQFEKIRGIDPTEGKLIWEFDAGHWAVPYLTNERVIVSDRSGGLTCLGLTTGKRHWSRKETSMAGNLIIRSDRLYAALEDGRLVARDLALGSPIWESSPSGPIRFPLSMAGPMLVARTGDLDFGSLRAVWVDNGQNGWTIRLGASTQWSVSHDLILITSPQGTRAVDPKNGKDLWSKPLTASAVEGPPGVLTAVQKGRVRAIETRSGRELWAGPDADTPLGSAGNATFAGAGRNLIALKSGDGVEVWRFECRSAPRSVKRFGNVLFVETWDWEQVSPVEGHVSKVNRCLYALRAVSVDGK